LLTLDIPGWGYLEIENFVLDLNGTMATDGKILPQAKEKAASLAKNAKVYILTADTQGTAQEESRGWNVELVRIAGEESKKQKMAFLKTLNLEKTVVMGNGNNDGLILQEAALGVAVLGDEGLSVAALMHADIIVKDIGDALELFLKPKRIIATLRE